MRYFIAWYVNIDYIYMYVNIDYIYIYVNIDYIYIWYFIACQMSSKQNGFSAGF